jgi:hypothetical protein
MQVDQAGVRRTEAARIDVEGPKVGLEVDVEPLASCGFRVPDSAADQFGADTTALPLAARLGVEQKRVVSTVPGDLDEPDENAVAGARCHPAETVRSDLIPISPLPVARRGSRPTRPSGQPP